MQYKVFLYCNVILAIYPLFIRKERKLLFYFQYNCDNFQHSLDLKIKINSIHLAYFFSILF